VGFEARWDGRLWAAAAHVGRGDIASIVAVSALDARER
jgi:hypothetical protein